MLFRKLYLTMPLPKQFHRVTIQYFLTSLITLLLVFGWGETAYSQLPSFPTDANSSLLPPSDVIRQGEYETAPVRSPLDNKILFSVTSPTIFNRDNIPEGKLPVEIRAEEVNQRLWRVLSRTTAADKTPTVEISTLNNRFILQIRDDQTSRPVRVVTVTEPDADYQGKTLDELAQDWKKILQSEIDRFRLLASPKVFIQRLWEATQILFGLIIASVVIYLLRRIVSRRHQKLEALHQQELAAEIQPKASNKERNRNAESTLDSTAVDADITEGELTEAHAVEAFRIQFIETMQRQFSVKRRLDADKFLKWLLLWTFILMWYVGTYQIMSRVPLLMRWSGYVLATPLELVLIWFFLSFILRLSKSLIDRFLHSRTLNPYLQLGNTQRIALRTATISNALKGLVTFILVVTGIVLTLNLFNIPTSSILAGGAVIGLAISFGSQSLIKDLVNGCLILVEDQFAVGDVIQIDDKSGLVENLNLRVTQLRNAEGRLITIPNSNISNVSNLTRLWSRVDFSILVAYENDPIQVMDILRQVAKQLHSEPEWRSYILEKPQVLGIDDLSHTGMLVRVWIKTVPMEQWSVGREFRLRVHQAFESNQIQIGKPQLINYNADLETSTPKNSDV